MPSNSLNNELAGSSPDELNDDPRLNIRDELAGEWDAELLFLSEEEFDEAIIGVAERIGDEPVVAYDTTKIMEILSRSMSVDEAYEFFEFNILGAYVGDKTPLFITTAFKQ
jgi:hypothetical protein